MESLSHTQRSITSMQSAIKAGNQSIKKLIQRLKKMDQRKLDDLVHELHSREFEKIDCLQCANCCKTISPAIHEGDLRRMAQALKIKVGDLVDSLLDLDEEGDYVFKKMPCPFLFDNNVCSIYNNRPRACREYPHTDRKKFYQILDLTSKNAAVCPAVFNITLKLMKD
jgi:Fe-S-cluster containining protein